MIQNKKPNGDLFLQTYIDHNQNSLGDPEFIQWYGVFNRHAKELARFKFKTHAIKFVDGFRKKRWRK